eukprot:18684-Heterococcus_DN1.PRE.4
MTTMRFGSCVRLNILLLVRYGALLRPSICGSAAEPPVAMTAFLKVSVVPLTQIVLALVNAPLPMKTSIDRAVENRWALSWTLMSARNRRMRSITYA